MLLRRSVAATVAAMALGGLLAGPAPAAERFYGVTASNRLVTFHSDSPGAIRSSRALTGLGKAGVRAIDVRPATGQLYALATNDRLYKINTRTGRATPVGSPIFDQRSAAVGFDFNPTVDKIRVVNTSGQNARIDPDTGAREDGDPDLSGVQPDRPLRYDANDPASGVAPRIAGVGYTNSRARATSTELFGIDRSRNTLIRIDPPNDGVVRTVGRLGGNVDEPVGFDIAGGRGYAAFSVKGTRAVGLFTVDLDSGRAKPAAPLTAIQTYRGRRADPVRALAAAGAVAKDATPPRVGNSKLNNPTISELVRGKALRLRVDCSEACIVAATFKLRGRVIGVGAGVVLGRQGAITVPIKLTRRGKRLVRRFDPPTLKVRLSATDFAGNSVATK